MTKNALDFAQFLVRDERPYFDGWVVGLIATAGWEMAGTNAIRGMVNVVHALRQNLAPLMVAVLRAWERTDGDGNVPDSGYGGWLESLGRLVVDLASRLVLKRRARSGCCAPPPEKSKPVIWRHPEPGRRNRHYGEQRALGRRR